MVSLQIFKQISCLLAFNFCLMLQANINNLKGTFDILKDEYKEFSIVNGAIVDQTDYIMRLYDFGTLGKVKQVTNPDQTIVTVPDTSTASDVIKLVHLFFYRVPGTTNRTDFVLNKNLAERNVKGKKETIQTLAWIIACTHKSMQLLAQTLKDAINKVIPDGGETSIQDVLKFDSLANLDAQTIIDKINDHKLNKKQIAALKAVKLIFTAIGQETTVPEIFPAYTTNSVLLGIVYKLAGNDKSLLQAFYEKLNDALIKGQKGTTATIFVNEGSIGPNWVNEQFTIADRQALGQSLTFDAGNGEQLKQYYENIVYLALLPGEIPQQVAYIRPTYHYDPNDDKKTVIFPDCMETMLRNIFNILLYVKEELVLKLTKLSGIDPIQSLKDFYQENNDASTVENPALHDRWAQVVENNIPFVAYKRKVGEIKTAPDLGHVGFIKVPAGINVGDDYIPVGENDIIYEVRPTLKNFIIIFNHLLQLNLFDNEVGNTQTEKIAAAFVRKDFIKTYFPLLCKRLNITFNGFFEGTVNVTDIVDTKDYGPEITTKLIIDSTSVDLITRMGHGCIDIIAQTTETNPLLEWGRANIQTIFNPEKKFFDSYFFSLPYLTAYKKQTILDGIESKIDSSHFFNLLYYLPIGNADYVKKFIDILSNSKKQLDTYVIQFLLYLCSNIPDENQKQLANLQIYKIIIMQPWWSPIGGLPGIKNSSAPKLIEAAVGAVQSKNADLQIYGRVLLMVLVQKGEGYPEAILAASDAIKSYNPDTALGGLNLFKALVEKGQAYHLAILVASEAIKSYNSDTALGGLNLFKALFEQGQGFPEAIQAASDAFFNSKNLYQPTRGLNLFKALVEKGQAYPKAIQAASDAIKSYDSVTAFGGLNLFEALFKKGQGYKEAKAFASAAITGDYSRIQLALDLFEVLVRNGQAYSEALDAISYVVINEYAMRHSAAELFNIVLLQLDSITSERLTPESQKTIRDAIQVGNILYSSIELSDKTMQLLLKLKQKMQQK